MIRDAILTCARKPTWVGLIYRTETTTKIVKQKKKLKSKSRYVRSNSKSLKKKKKGCGGKDLQKKKDLSLEWKERVGDEKLIIITNECNCQGHKWPYKILQLNALHSCHQHPNRVELSMGPFCETRSNPTHQLTDPTRPNPIQVEKFGPNPKQLTTELTVY